MPSDPMTPHRDTAAPPDEDAFAFDTEWAPENEADYPVADTLIRNMAATIAVFLALSVVADALLEHFGG